MSNFVSGTVAVLVIGSLLVTAGPLAIRFSRELARTLNRFMHLFYGGRQQEVDDNFFKVLGVAALLIGSVFLLVGIARIVLGH